MTNKSKGRRFKMKDKKQFKHLLIALATIIGISFWIETAGDIEAKAASLTQATPINQIFPDPEMAEFMQSQLNKTTVTDPVSQDELNRVSYIIVGDAGIESIEGVQYLNNLTIIMMTQNNISDISPVSELKNLQTLYFNDNKISNISGLSSLTNLVSLSIDGNQISDISPLSSLPNLYSLTMSSNKISDLSALSGLTNLVSLSIDGNQISDISPISSLTNLNELLANNNQINDVSGLSRLINLTMLQLNNNQISNVSPLSDLVKLTWLLIDDNQISDLSALKDLTWLMTVSMENQQVNNKAVDYQTELTISNIVKDNTGGLVLPVTMSDNGSYSSPDITWDLPEYKTQVSYTFNQQVQFGGATGTFSGTVNQPLKKAILEYEAIFDVDGVETSEVVEQDSLLSEPPTPTKEGYTFTGWYDAPKEGSKWDFETDKMPKNNIKLYAQFKINPYIVTLDVDGKITSQTVDYQNHVQTPTEPTKAGYVFMGWYDKRTGGIEWNFETDKMPANDMTLYAQFTGVIKPIGPIEPASPTIPGVDTEYHSGLDVSEKAEKSATVKIPTDKLPKTGDKNNTLPIFLGILCLGLAAFLGFRWKQVK
ncbi:LPXTG cell wall anchor domain-containing protein [Listeria monocytogenes]|nr:LPXTG cell wall anchor domain-containing protein [Listeria monocytogenes]EAV9818524.1 LPXTG cell wall anchor domain-containing protein [Listeria monocytogenes]ECL0113560.1 LPXTG cell wall anchor domain-containing protein [Listeria monocytogenes]ECL0266193.1 LPXTG cell wall anchor domain-containing protein [Listeria monocytogenes]